MQSEQAEWAWVLGLVLGCAAGHVNMWTEPGEVKWGRWAVGGDVPHGIGMRAHHLLASLSLQSMGILINPPHPHPQDAPSGRTAAAA